MPRPSPRSWWAPTLLAAVSLLPHLDGALPRLSYYFRDFTLTFYPLRLLQARELAAGRWPFWNPYVNEGAFLLIAYPVDLLHALWPGPAGVSWLLTLHFPLAALGAYALARELGAGRLGAFAAGAVYALGGLAISSLNLYVFLQALALAPFVALTLRRAASRGRQWMAAAALTLGLALSTLAVEFVGQALLLGLVLALLARPERAWRAAAATALGVCLAGFPVAVVAGLLPETERGRGFSSVTAASYALHPFALLQAIVPNALGSPAAPLERWWGGRFFPGGFPYFASLYVGPLAVALACAGLPFVERRLARALLVLGGLGLLYAFGDWGGLAPLVSSLPGLRALRFPSKALLMPFLALALLAGFGADALARGDGWRRLRGAIAVQAALVAALAAALVGARSAVERWLAVSPDMGAVMVATLKLDALRVGALCALGAAAAFGVLTGRAAPARAALLVVVLGAADMALAAQGQNPMTSPAFFRPLPEIAALGLARLPDGGRVFSYGVQFSPRMRALLATHARGLGLWAFFANRQMLAPFNNVLDGVETAEGLDRTSSLPQPPRLTEADYAPANVAAALPALREASVSRVLSLDALEHADLRLIARVPVGAAGLEIHAYELTGAWPRRYVACRVLLADDARAASLRVREPSFEPGRDVVLEGAAPAATCGSGEARLLTAVPGLERYAVTSDAPGYLVTRDSYARGFSAEVDGARAPVLRANGRHRAVPLPGGAHEVTLRYDPPGLRLGLAAFALGALAVVLLGLAPRAKRSLV